MSSNKITRFEAELVKASETVPAVKDYLHDLRNVRHAKDFHGLLEKARTDKADPGLAATAARALKGDEEAMFEFAEAVIQTRIQPKVHKR